MIDRGIYAQVPAGTHLPSSVNAIVEIPKGRRSKFEVDRATGRHMVCVFVPSSPTPFTGYAVLFPEEEVIHLALAVEDALRFVISGGVVLPGAPPASGRQVGFPPRRLGEGPPSAGPKAPTSSR